MATTHVNTDEIDEWVAEQIAQRRHKFQIKGELEARLEEKVDIKAFEFIYTKAKKLIMENSKVPRQDHKALSQRFWEGIIADPKSKMREKMRAQVELQNLLGIGAAFEQGPADPRESAREIREALAEEDGLYASE